MKMSSLLQTTEGRIIFDSAFLNFIISKLVSEPLDLVRDQGARRRNEE